jgi:hypothetical protein
LFKIDPCKTTNRREKKKKMAPRGGLTSVRKNKKKKQSRWNVDRTDFEWARAYQICGVLYPAIHVVDGQTTIVTSELSSDHACSNNTGYYWRHWERGRR